MKLRLLGRVCTCLAITCMMTSAAMADVTGDSGNDGGAIPDNSSAGVVSTVTITESEVITNAHFSIEGLSHSWIGDLIVEVTHVQSGRSATLVNRVGTTSSSTSVGDSSDVNGTYTFSDGEPSIWTEAANGDTDFDVTPGKYAASGVNEAFVGLDSTFAGFSTAGDWEFRISDNNATQTGSYTQASVKFTTTAVPEPGTMATIVLGTLFGGVYLRRRHKKGVTQEA